MFVCKHVCLHVYCQGALDNRGEVRAEDSRRGFGELPGCSLSIESKGLEQGLGSWKEMCRRTRRRGSVCVCVCVCEALVKHCLQALPNN